MNQFFIHCMRAKLKKHQKGLWRPNWKLWRTIFNFWPLFSSVAINEHLNLACRRKHQSFRSYPILSFLFHCSEASGRLDTIRYRRKNLRYDYTTTFSHFGPKMMDTQIEATTTTTRPIGIKTTYIIDGNDGTTTSTSETFDASRSDACEARVGLPVGTEAVKVRYVSKHTLYAEKRR